MKTASDALYDLIKEFEGFSREAYTDPIGIPTIAYGIIKYPDGTNVKLGDVCTDEQAQQYLEHEVNKKTKAIYTLIDTDTLNQNQFDAVVDFAYNCGTGNLSKSTLLKKAKVNPDDPTIRNEFLKWNKAGGKVLNGLTRRRQAEADLYFS